MTDRSPCPTTVDRWRATLSEHRPVDGRCPKCGTPRRCRVWGEAFAQLLAHDLLDPRTPPPPEDVRTQSAAGEEKREEVP